MSFGLSLGLIVALAVYIGRPPVQAPRVAERVGASAPASGPPAPVVDQSAPAESRFDFYELLPQFEVVIPEIETDAKADSTASAVEKPGRYVLQAGSFSTLADADRMQANLALLGVETRIQHVSIDDDEFHRVRIGPMSDLTQLNQIRRRLRDARIETILMRVPE